MQVLLQLLLPLEMEVSIAVASMVICHVWTAADDVCMEHFAMKGAITSSA